MTNKQLAASLRRAYFGARRNEAACQIHLFGIRYAAQLQTCGCPIREIAALSGIPMGYLPELSKGIKLARYVQLKEADEP